jgi:hypothetical protein
MREEVCHHTSSWCLQQQQVRVLHHLFKTAHFDCSAILGGAAPAVQRLVGWPVSSPCPVDLDDNRVAWVERPVTACIFVGTSQLVTLAYIPIRIYFLCITSETIFNSTPSILRLLYFYDSVWVHHQSHLLQINLLFSRNYDVYRSSRSDFLRYSPTQHQPYHTLATAPP